MSLQSIDLIYLNNLKDLKNAIFLVKLSLVSNVLDI